MTEPDRSERRFEHAWREWATRPPSMTPERAAREVARALGRRHERRAWVGPLAAIAASLLVTVLAARHWLGREPAPESPPIEVAEAAAPLDNGVVLMWLDPETPLYMTYHLPEGDPSTGDPTP